MSHPTPRPWRNANRYIHDGNGSKVIAELPYGGYPHTRVDAANTALIVRAVNAHDGLVQALREALPYLRGDRYPVPVTDEYGAFLDRVEAALEAGR